MTRRSPLTKAQQATAARLYKVAVDVAHFYRHRTNLHESDLLSEAHEALTAAISTHNPELSPIEDYAWFRVCGAVRNLIQRAPKHAALDDYALALPQDDDPFEDPETTLAAFGELAHEAMTALVLGDVGHAWHTRGEESVVLRTEYLRTMKSLHNEVARLPPAYATVVELRYFRELSIDDVAQEAGINARKVPRLLTEAMRLLRARLRAHGIVGSPAA